MEINDIKKVIEALLFVSDKPLLTREIKSIIKEDLPQDANLEDILKQMQEEYKQLERAFELKFVADGWTFGTLPQYSSWIKKMLKEKMVLKLSPSAMEVLAIIAYKQPITRAEIDNIRGVDCGGVIDTLTDRKFIKIVGRKETLGKPLLYGTTQEFLRHFGLSHLSELPVIENAEDNIAKPEDQKTQELPFDQQEGVAPVVPSLETTLDTQVSDSQQQEVEQQPSETVQEVPVEQVVETVEQEVAQQPVEQENSEIVVESNEQQQVEQQSQDNTEQPK